MFDTDGGKYEKKNRNGTPWPEPGSRHTGRNKYVPNSFYPDTGSWKTGWTQESGTWYFYKDGVKQTRLADLGRKILSECRRNHESKMSG